MLNCIAIQYWIQFVKQCKGSIAVLSQLCFRILYWIALIAICLEYCSCFSQLCFRILYWIALIAKPSVEPPFLERARVSCFLHSIPSYKYILLLMIIIIIWGYHDHHTNQKLANLWSVLSAFVWSDSVSYTHLTLPTNREV